MGCWSFRARGTGPKVVLEAHPSHRRCSVTVLLLPFLNAARCTAVTCTGGLPDWQPDGPTMRDGHLCAKQEYRCHQQRQQSVPHASPSLGCDLAIHRSRLEPRVPSVPRSYSGWVCACIRLGLDPIAPKVTQTCRGFWYGRSALTANGTPLRPGSGARAPAQLNVTRSTGVPAEAQVTTVVKRRPSYRGPAEAVPTFDEPLVEGIDLDLVLISGSGDADPRVTIQRGGRARCPPPARSPPRAVPRRAR